MLEGPTALRGTLMSKPPLGSFSPRRHGSLCGSRPVSQSHTVFRMAWRTLQGEDNSKTAMRFLIKQLVLLHTASPVNYECDKVIRWYLEGINNLLGFNFLYTREISMGAAEQEFTGTFRDICRKTHSPSHPKLGGHSESADLGQIQLGP